MKSMLLLSIILVPVLLSCKFPGQVMTIRKRKWADEEVAFAFSVTDGTASKPFAADILIANKSDKSLSFPTPFVMPQAGDTNKNNILVFDQDGNELEMTGEHRDYVERPVSTIPPNSAKIWRFELDPSFPQMGQPGTYSVQFRYFSDGRDTATWKGRVNMEPITVVRKKPLIRVGGADE